MSTKHLCAKRLTGPTGAILSLICCGALAQSSSDNYGIERGHIANGGGLSLGSNFRMNGSVGQALPHPKKASANYRLSGGFWFAEERAGDNRELLFADGFESQ